MLDQVIRFILEAKCSTLCKAIRWTRAASFASCGMWLLAGAGFSRCAVFATYDCAVFMKCSGSIEPSGSVYYCVLHICNSDVDLAKQGEGWVLNLITEGVPERHERKGVWYPA